LKEKPRKHVGGRGKNAFDRTPPPQALPLLLLRGGAAIKLFS